MRYLIEVKDGDMWHSSGYAYDSIAVAKVKARLLLSRGLPTRVIDTQTGEVA
jgi:hypothetical protein